MPDTPTNEVPMTFTNTFKPDSAEAPTPSAELPAGRQTGSPKKSERPPLVNPREMLRDVENTRTPEDLRAERDAQSRGSTEPSKRLRVSARTIRDLNLPDEVTPEQQAHARELQDWSNEKELHETMGWKFDKPTPEAPAPAEPLQALSPEARALHEFVVQSVATGDIFRHRPGGEWTSLFGNPEIWVIRPKAKREFYRLWKQYDNSQRKGN